MRTMKKFGVLAVVALALSVIGVANASAATFTASATGSLTGKATATQEFTINAGTVKCTTIHVSGTILSTASPEQHATVEYTGCTGPLGVPVHNIKATYLFTANGDVHIKETITITVTAPFGATCTVTVKPQTVKSVAYSNSGSNLKLTPNVSGIVYSTSGGFCGSGGNNGTYKGSSEVSRVGGGSVSWDA